MAVSLPETTDGPDRRRWNVKCRGHHTGTRSGEVTDWCCCCSPCLYERPPQTLNQIHCCRCVPIAICLVFTPDVSADPCCRTVVQTLFATHSSIFGYTTYSGGVDGGLFEVRLGKEDTQECAWHFISIDLGIDIRYDIDHTVITCLEVPGLEVTGFTNASGCVGTLTFSAYNGDKVPFRLRDFSDSETYDPPDTEVTYTPCDCATMPKILCVSGVRHLADDFDDVEHVEFVFNQSGVSPRWQYLPLGGNPTTDREIIYLRGDSYGNCYLELDFEQSGSHTNDWADPPNTLGVNEQEVRDGMILLDNCGCGLRVQATSTGFRDIRIHAGPCGRWNYKCGRCRCMPRTICVIGEIDGVFFDEEMTWDGDGWTYDHTTGTYPNSVRFQLGSNSSGDCVLTVEGSFSIPFTESTPLDCSQFMSFEVETDKEYYPTQFNWLWGQSGVCGCNHSICAICAEERCGSNPSVLYVELQGRTICDHLVDPTCTYDLECNLTVAVHYWQRWSNGTPKTIDCGYIGYASIACGSVNYLLRVQLTALGTILRISRLNLNTGVTSTLTALDGDIVTPSTCDPYYYGGVWEPNTSTETPADNCFWGCGRIAQVKVTIVE